MTISRTKRLSIYERDHYRCRYCGQDLLPMLAAITLDHLLPTARGGTDAPENLVTACAPCNHRKADLHLAPQPICGPPRSDLELTDARRELARLAHLTGVRNDRRHEERLRRRIKRNHRRSARPPLETEPTGACDGLSAEDLARLLAEVRDRNEAGAARVRAFLAQERERQRTEAAS